MTSLVSILIPVYNCREWAARAIESALQQTWPNTEIIVVDDCSTDGSWEIIQSFAGQINLERAVPNCGQSAIRNRLTDLSKGEWLVYLDADDELMPDCVEKKMMVCDEADAVYGTMEEAWFDRRKRTLTTIRQARDYKDQFAAAFWWRFPNTSSFMFRKTVVEEVAGWSSEVQNCIDYDLHFRLLLRDYRFRAAPESATLYRHWSEGQACSEQPVRLFRSRLALMWSAVHELESLGGLSQVRVEAFEQAAFGVIRLLYQVDPQAARLEHARLLQWNSDFLPIDATVSFRYCLTYRLVGFEVAERLANLVRPLKAASKPRVVQYPSRRIHHLNLTGSSTS